MSISQQDQEELRELRIRQAEDAWQQFFKKHPEVADLQANRMLFADKFTVRHPKTGEFLGETIPTLQTLEAAFETLKRNISYVEQEPNEPAPEPPSQSEIVAEYNSRLLQADKEVLRDVEKVRSAMFFGLVPNSPEWIQSRLPHVSQEINYFLNPPEPVNSAHFQSPSAPQLTPAETELGERLKAKGVDIPSDRSSVVRWLHSEADNDMASVRKFLRDSNGRIDRNNEMSLQSVLRGE